MRGVSALILGFWFMTVPLVFADVTNPPSSSTERTSFVASKVTDQVLLGRNMSRIGATIFNDSTANLFIAWGQAATTSFYSLKMAAGSYYEVPFGWVGEIHGIWDSANGFARITEAER